MALGHRRPLPPQARRGPLAGPLALPLLGALLVPALVGCDGGPDVTPPDSSEPTFLRPAASAPPLLTRDTAVVATRGEDLRVELFYEDPDAPGQPGERFLRFELDDASLARYPEDHPAAGAAFEPGDTVTIRIRVSGDTLLAEFEPTGLRFDPDEPAELELRYVEADPDFDGDGDDDPELEDEIDLWRQEQPGAPWVRIGDVKDLERDELRAFLESFTRFAAAI